MIKLKAAGILAAGFGLLAITGCNKTSAPKGEVTLAEMNRAVGRMSMMGRPPQTVDELTNFHAFKGRPLPVPPAGKKLILNQSTREVVVVDK